MRHETCFTCQVPGSISGDLKLFIRLAESVAGPEFMHHHHLVECGGCGQWWFDDVTIVGLGIPVPARRDTQFCECDENLKQYAPHAVTVPEPEKNCACTKASVDRNRLPIALGPEKMPAPRHCTGVLRSTAVSDIAARIDAKDTFIVSVPPEALHGAAAQLRKLRTATCYLDCGMPGVLRLRSPHLKEAADLAAIQPSGTMSAVYLVPKTIPAAALSKLLGSEVPPDGSQDLVMLQAADGQPGLALLAVDAISMLDPAMAAAFQAADIRNMS